MEVPMSVILSITTRKWLFENQAAGMREVLAGLEYFVGRDVPMAVVPLAAEICRDSLLKEYPELEEAVPDFLPGEHMQWLAKQEEKFGTKKQLTKASQEENLKINPACEEALRQKHCTMVSQFKVANEQKDQRNFGQIPNSLPTPGPCSTPTKNMEQG